MSTSNFLKASNELHQSIKNTEKRKLNVKGVSRQSESPVRAELLQNSNQLESIKEFEPNLVKSKTQK